MSKNSSAFQTRKRDHLKLALHPAVQTPDFNRLDSVRLLHQALPEIDWKDVELKEDSTAWKGLFAGKKLKPFYISGMTAGHEKAPKLNRLFAKVAADYGWVFAVGSQRNELHRGSDIDRWHDLKAQFPELVLVGNLGISQLVSGKMRDILALFPPDVFSAIAIHLNALQEALQPEGTPDFRNGIIKLKELKESAPLPVILKETGCGFSDSALNRAFATGVAAVDVSGLGGTHWGKIEGLRAGKQKQWKKSQAAEVFQSWGVTTVESLIAAKNRLANHTEIWASGGIRHGLDAARAIALGAHRVGFAHAALKSASAGEKALRAWVEQVEFELQVALFCTGNMYPRRMRERARIMDDGVSGVRVDWTE